MDENLNSFEATLDKFNSNLWGYHITVPALLAQSLIDQGIKRVICTLNDTLEFQCALMPKGDGLYFININKANRDKLRLRLGSLVRVSLRQDNSTYGLPMPDEFQEVLLQDEEGDQLFHALTPGKQRTLLYIVGSVKNPDLRINRALVVLEHLKANKGKINYRQLYADLKQSK